jgi:hypothetical protein
LKSWASTHPELPKPPSSPPPGVFSAFKMAQKSVKGTLRQVQSDVSRVAGEVKEKVKEKVQDNVSGAIDKASEKVSDRFKKK